jgi:hypothetical protein
VSAEDFLCSWFFLERVDGRLALACTTVADKKELKKEIREGFFPSLFVGIELLGTIAGETQARVYADV